MLCASYFLRVRSATGALASACRGHKDDFGYENATIPPRPVQRFSSTKMASNNANRRSSAARAVQAANDAFPVALSPSPLLKPIPTTGPVGSPLYHCTTAPRPPSLKKIAAALQAAEVDRGGLTTGVTDLLRDIDAHQPRPRPVNHTALFSLAQLRLILSFVGNTFCQLRCCALSCRRFQAACYGAVTEVCAVPVETRQVDVLSKRGTMCHFAQLLETHRHGQHLTSVQIVDGAFASANKLGPGVLGPHLHSFDLCRAIVQLPRMTTLDIRGVVLRDYVPWSDHFLSDVATSCSALRVLRIGCQFVRQWEVGWWAPLTQLKEFVIGSRREDSEWLEETVVHRLAAPPSAAAAPAPNSGGLSAALAAGGGSTTAAGLFPAPPGPAATAATPTATTTTMDVAPPAVALPWTDDGFSMLRVLPITVAKLWFPLPPSALTHGFLAPTTSAFPSLVHLTLNLAGNHGTKLFDDPPAAGADGGTGAGGAGSKEKKAAPDAKAKAAGGKGDPADAGGANAGGKGGAAASTGAASVPYPALKSLTLCDVKERPEAISEVMARFPQLAPQWSNLSVTNTNRQLPKPPAPVDAKGRGPRAPPAAAPPS